MTESDINTKFAERLAEFDAAKYERISLMHSGDYDNFMTAQDIIRKFIKRAKLILYGGIAIDYALRTRGDKIYDDNDIPDYDFWSPDSIATTYEILDELIAALPEVKVYGHSAKYPRTMRVSVGNNNWVADITYVPKDLFALIPTLEYDGLRTVHPHMQFADLHSSLSYPYDNAPREVIFARWKKDITRYEKLWALFPIERTTIDWNYEPVKIPREIMTRAIISGFAAYSLFFNAVPRDAIDRIEGEIGFHIPHVMPPNMSAKYLRVDMPRSEIDVFTHTDPVRVYSGTYDHYYQFLDLIEPLAVRAESDPRINMHSTSGRFINFVSFPIGDSRVRCSSYHGMLRFFAAHYVHARYFAKFARIHRKTPAGIFAMYYIAMRILAKAAENTPASIYFRPSTDVFGEYAPPIHSMVEMFDIINRMFPQQKFTITTQPRNIRADAEHITFNYSECPFMRISSEPQ